MMVGAVDAFRNDGLFSLEDAVHLFWLNGEVCGRLLIIDWQIQRMGFL